MPASKSECLRLDSEFADREVDLLLVLPQGLSCAFVLGQPPSDGTSLLVTEVEGEILLALVELPEVLALLLVGDSQNAGY